MVSQFSLICDLHVTESDFSKEVDGIPEDDISDCPLAFVYVCS